VTVDPNGRFYRLDDALPVIRAMDAVGNMSILEDPFPRFHLAEFVELRPLIKGRLVLHVDPPETLHQVIAARAAGGLNLDSSVQGLLAWRSQAAMAAQSNLPVWHGSGLDLGVATAAQLHLAAATPNCQLPGDQSGPWLRESTLVKTPFVVEQGHVLVPPGEGNGIEVDLDAVERYSSKKWTFST
jgi:muconate cycloisomerase